VSVDVKEDGEELEMRKREQKGRRDLHFDLQE
jgi:hypothetical protein